MCDVCLAAASGQEIEKRDISTAAVAVVRTLAEWPSAEKRATLIQVRQIWRSRPVRLSPHMYHTRIALGPRVSYMTAACHGRYSLLQLHFVSPAVLAVVRFLAE